VNDLTTAAVGLAAENYSFRVNGQILLDRVTLHIAAGTRCAIIGANGAGKSTLLKSFLRLLPAGDGELRIGERPVSRYTQRALARWLAYVPQAGSADTDFAVRDFVLMGRYPYLSPWSTVTREDRLAVAAALEQTGLEAFAGRALNTLSGGERQKAYLAAALAQGGRILLLDEPTAFLDPFQAAQVYAVLGRLHRELGLTLVEVTHDVNRAALGHDQVIGLSHGRVVFDGTPEALMNAETLFAIYGHRFYLAPHPHSGRMVAWPEAAA
jgi:iron complex transport system ATP-binding protein